MNNNADQEFISNKEILNNYLHEASVECFDRCINNLNTTRFESSEKICINNCYEKYFLSFANMANLVNNNK